MHTQANTGLPPLATLAEITRAELARHPAGRQRMLAALRAGLAVLRARAPKRQRPLWRPASERRAPRPTPYQEAAPAYWQERLAETQPELGAGERLARALHLSAIAECEHLTAITAERPARFLTRSTYPELLTQARRQGVIE